MLVTQLVQIGVPSPSSLQALQLAKIEEQLTQVWLDLISNEVELQLTQKVPDNAWQVAQGATQTEHRVEDARKYVFAVQL